MSLRLIAAAVLLTGCGTMVVTQEARAVRDFIVVSELERVDIIRLHRQLYYTYVNDSFLTVSIGNRHYLVEFTSRCRALRSKTFTAAMVDHRYDPSYLRPHDTIRGCPIDRIYKATVEQLIEIKALSKAQATRAAVPAEG
ncbi:MAG: hypothetical protein IIA07_09905 [Proteobacteria bacterium]|nr:hypothetical protein [Pseudomonadota bacterium]